ncbi:hypothetical protein [Janibacter indicus]|uniref:hypothetical protein n=1 Tax=Janibacter indicus TaxID=857417 RepID=UPI003D9A2411
MRVTDRAQKRPTVRPLEETAPSCQVGGDGLASHQTASIEVDHRLGEQPRVDADRFSKGVQHGGAERSRAHLETGTLRDEFDDPLGQGSMPFLGRREAQFDGWLVGLTDNDKPLLRKGWTDLASGPVAVDDGCDGSP